MQQGLARWGFVIAGVVFLLIAVVPVVTGATPNVTFLVLAMVFLVLGAAIARKSAGRHPPAGRK